MKTALTLLFCAIIALPKTAHAIDDIKPLEAAFAATCGIVISGFMYAGKTLYDTFHPKDLNSLFQKEVVQSAEYAFILEAGEQQILFSHLLANHAPDTYSHMQHDRLTTRNNMKTENIHQFMTNLSSKSQDEKSLYEQRAEYHYYARLNEFKSKHNLSDDQIHNLAS